MRAWPGGRSLTAMNFVLGVVITAAAVAVAVAAMLLVRRRAPDGSYFNDGDRASGVFGVLATGFALLLGLIVFLAFTSYDDSKTGAESEALTVVQQFETAQFLPDAARLRLGGELICYGRSVVGQEWPRMEAGSENGAINPWALAMFRTMKTVQPTTGAAQSAYDKWFDLTSTREEAGATASTPPTASSRCRCGGCCSPSPRSSWSTCCSSPTAGNGRSSRAC
jgi:hypothetical protein